MLCCSALPRPLLRRFIWVLVTFSALLLIAPSWAVPGRVPGSSLLSHTRLQPGYLGVSLLDVDQELRGRLHLKDTRGAVILTVDRDAPAASVGLRPRDVILQLNGHRVDNVKELRHKLGELSSGTTIILQISRDGIEQGIAVRLGDEAEVEQRAWQEHYEASAPGKPTDASTNAAAVPAEVSARGDAGPTFVPPQGHAPGSSFLGVFSVSSLYTGIEVDPLTSQLAEYFGVHDGAGLLVRTVNTSSPAALAGLRAGDVILRVNAQPVVSRVDWVKQVRVNRGRAMQISYMRNRREQTATMTAGTQALHKKG